MDNDAGIGGDVQYSIVAGNEENIFDIDQTTGYVKVVQGRLLNYRQKKLHHLVVQAKDGKLYLNISVVDFKMKSHG